MKVAPCHYCAKQPPKNKPENEEKEMPFKIDTASPTLKADMRAYKATEWTPTATGGVVLFADDGRRLATLTAKQLRVYRGN